jgi:zinc ribbon protein
MADCPNCGANVPEGVRLCPNCGFDTREAQADEVRELRDQGRIHPGRVGTGEPADFAGGDPAERPEPGDELPAEEAGGRDPRETEGGL